MFKKRNSISSKNGIHPKRQTANSRSPVDRLLSAAVFSFLCGATVLLLALCAFAFLLAHTPVPLALVRPFACIATALGVALSGLLFAQKVGRRFLLCGLVCGFFYAGCQLLAAYILQGATFLQNGSIMLSVVVLMSGLFGGAFAAAKVVR